MRSCPLCGARASGQAFPYQTHWNGKDFFYIACSACETTYVDPVPSDADFASMYSKENYHDVHYGTIDTRAADASLTKFQRFRGPRRSILDYACGAGSFLAAARNFGYDCHGVEYADDVREAARKNSGANIISPAELDSIGMKFDLIHMGDILEHLPEPRETMLGLERHLAPGGLFMIEGPLQRNASPVFWSSACIKMLRRLLRFDRVAGTPPTHLILTSRSAQRLFFTHGMNYKCLHYELAESGWPYYVASERISTAGSGIKSLIGLASIALQFVDPIGVLGNRFLGIFEPEERSSAAQA